MVTGKPEGCSHPCQGRCQPSLFSTNTSFVVMNCYYKHNVFNVFCQCGTTYFCGEALVRRLGPLHFEWVSGLDWQRPCSICAGPDIQLVFGYHTILFYRMVAFCDVYFQDDWSWDKIYFQRISSLFHWTGFAEIKSHTHKSQLTI